MSEPEFRHPPHCANAIRTLLRFAVVLLIFGLLSGVAYQESAKKLPPAADEGLRRWDVALHLALVHGHVIVAGFLMPVAMAGMLHLAQVYGGREVGPRALKWSVRTYLPCVTLAVCLMLYKGYHFLLAVRAGAVDLVRVDAALFAGSSALRHGLYGLSHVGMAIGLCVFSWCIWRSLRPQDRHL